MKHDFRHSKDFQEYAEGQTLSRRISILTWIGGSILTAYLLFFWYLQVVESERYARLAEENRVRRVEVPPPRGAILDRNGQILVRNRLSFGLIVDREKADDLPRTLAALSRVLGVPRSEAAARFNRAAARRPRHEPVLLAEDVDLGTVAFVEARRADLPGVSIGIEDKRFYEAGASGAHLVGYVGEVSAGEIASGRIPGARQGDIVGKAGLERDFDADLRGRRGYRQVIVNNVGREVGELAGGTPPQAGANVRSSIDLDMQRALDLAYGARVGAAVFLDARTGEILALTSRPGYDPNLFVRRFNRSVWRALVSDPLHPLQNRAVQSAYSPGSTFKVILAAAALQERLITPATTFHCGGKEEFYGRVFSCHESHGGHGTVNLHTALVKSCNIYFYNVGRRMGIDLIAAYARRFGLGRPTGIRIAVEQAGLVPDEAWKQRVAGERWYPSETISVAIGQGPLLVTPIQQAVVAAAVATDGRLVSPRLRLDSPPARAASPAPGAGDKSGEPLRPEVLEVVRRAMWGVVNEWGTGYRALIPGFDVCGKTGTVQLTQASAGVKNEEALPPELRDHSWFIGFAPLTRPEVAFAVFVENGGHGSEAAAPLARAVLESYFRKRPRVPPRTPPPTEVALGSPGAAARTF